MSILRLSASGLVAAVAMLCVAPDARAVTAERVIYPNAASWCQGALPAFSGTLRARPLAILNEGASNAFVTCSFPGGEDPSASPQTYEVGVWVINRGGAARTVSCTLVDGYESSSAPTEDTSYTPKSVEIPAGDAAFLTWSPSELPGDPDFIYNPNLSCLLPPGTGLGYLYFGYNEEVGA